MQPATASGFKQFVVTACIGKQVDTGAAGDLIVTSATVDVVDKRRADDDVLVGAGCDTNGSQVIAEYRTCINDVVIVARVWAVVAV